MRYPLSARLLILLAQYFDYRERVASVSNVMAALAGDPRFHRHREWAENFIRHQDKLRQTVHDLKRRGYLQEKIFGQAKTKGFLLTPKGQARVFELTLSVGIKKVKLGHGQWLMIFFDIPETQKKQRDLLRRQMRIFGFEPLQKSVWATAYDVRREVREWLQYHRLEEHVKLLIVRELTV